MPMHKQRRPGATSLFAVVFLFTIAQAGFAARLSLVASQMDLRSAAGDPNASFVPSAVSYNPVLGKLLVAGGGTNGCVIEWDMTSGVSTLIVPRANWGGGSSPAVFAAAYAPRIGSYLIACGGDVDALLAAQPGVSN